MTDTAEILFLLSSINRKLKSSQQNVSIWNALLQKSETILESRTAVNHITRAFGHVY